MKQAFGASRKVAKEQRGVNYANQRFQNGGFQSAMRASPVSAPMFARPWRDSPEIIEERESR